MVKVRLDRGEDKKDYDYEFHFRRSTYEGYEDFGRKDRSFDVVRWLRVMPLDYYLLAKLKEKLRNKRIALYEETTKDNQTYKEVYDVVKPQYNFIIERILAMHIGLEYVRKLPLFDHNLDLEQLTAEQINRLPTRLPKTNYGGVRKVRLNCSVDTAGIFTIIPDVLPQAQPISFSHLFSLGLQEYVLDEGFSFARMQQDGIRREVDRLKEEITEVAEKLEAVAGTEMAPVEFLREYKGTPIVVDENLLEKIWEKNLTPSDVKNAIGRLINAGELRQVSESPEIYEWVQ